MAWSQSDLAALETAIRSGVKRVRYSPTYEVEYQTLAEMLTLRDQMKSEIDGGGAGGVVYAGRL